MPRPTSAWRWSSAIPAYRNVPALPNPVNDAAAIALLFKSAGFDSVELRRDVGISDLRRAVREFADKSQDADIAVVFYAGHGMEVGGVNYLVPVDAKLASDFDIEDEAMSLDRISQAIEPARRLRLVILDACRDNPFAKIMKRSIATRSVGRGLAKVEPAPPTRWWHSPPRRARWRPMATAPTVRSRPRC